MKSNNDESKEKFDLSNKSFIKNEGQLRGDDSKNVNFYYSHGGMNVYLTNKGISYQFNKIHKPKQLTALINQSIEIDHKAQEKIEKLQEEVYLETHRIDLELINSNQRVQITGKNGVESPIHYYNENGVFTSKQYKKITYKNIYPYIDWVIYTNAKGGIKYDFIVHPKGNPKQIKFKINWADDLKLTDRGALEIISSMGIINENKPKTFQGNNLVKSSFVLQDGVLSYNVDSYNRQEDLIIDPAVIWATYYGGSSAESAGEYSCVVDGSDNVYLAGTTESTSAIASGGHQNTYSGGGLFSGDAFLVKFNSAGVRQWATYYGGTDDEFGNSCAVDGSNNVYLAGTTKSTGGIASGGHQGSFAGGFRGDAFLVKFNSAGVRQWGTYYGGRDDENGRGCTVDGANNVYLVGYTESNSGIATAGGHQNAISSSREHAFLVKFNSAGVRQWGTYYGDAPSPTTWTFGNAVVCDGANNVYLGGSAFGTSDISSAQTTVATPGAHQTAHDVDVIDQYDAFLVKFNSAGVRQWGTYYGGGEDSDYGTNLAVDGADNVYLVGLARSTTGIGSGGHQNTLGGGDDAFMVKFNSAGVRQWGTYYGGTSTDYAGGVAISGADLYLSGSARSTASIASGGFDNTQGGGGAYDAFIVRFNLSGVRQWGSYFGGASSDFGHYTAVDGNGDIYMSGFTGSSTSVAQSGHQNTIGGGDDAFLVKISNNPCGACVLGGSGSVWTWTGCQSTDWFNPCNWDRQTVPNTTSNVIIPNTTNKPLINGAAADCFDITIQSSTGARLDLNSTGGGILNITKP